MCQFAPLKARVCHVYAAISFSRRLSQDRAKKPSALCCGGGGGICFSQLICRKAECRHGHMQRRWCGGQGGSPSGVFHRRQKPRWYPKSFSDHPQKMCKIECKKKNLVNILSHTQMFGALEPTEFRRTRIYNFRWRTLATSNDIFHFPFATLV